MPRTNQSDDVDPNDEASVMRAIAGASFHAVGKSAGALEQVGLISDLKVLLGGR